MRNANIKRKPRSPMGDRLLTLRQQRRLTQEQVGLLVGLSQSQIQRMETYGSVSLAAFIRVADVYGASLDFIVHGSPNSQSAA